VIFHNRFTRWLARKAERVAIRHVADRRPDFYIGGEQNPYMKRWWLLFDRNSIFTNLFNAYLHEFVRDDDDRALHDHPYWSISISLGRIFHHETARHFSYVDEIYRDENGVDVRRMVLPGSVVIRSGKFAHRMVVPQQGYFTIFITGPRFREWGFLCPNGWKSWKEFTAPDDSGMTGRGCGE
jgi:hypothetical protein